LAHTVKSGAFEDEAMVRFSNDGNVGNDWMDAKKLNPLSSRYLAIPVYGEDEVLAINSLPVPESEIQIPIGFDFTASGKVTFGLRKNTLPEGWSATLVDTKTGARIPVTTGFAFSFDHEFAGKVRTAEEIVGSPLEMKSVSEPRFTLIVTPSKTTSNERGNLPAKLALEQNYPNPFNPSTSIRFALPQAGKVKLEVMNLLGQTVATVANGAFPAGNHAIHFDASKLASGMYLYRLSADGTVLTRKMTLVK
jgi:hypothetical protein